MGKGRGGGGFAEMRVWGGGAEVGHGGMGKDRGGKGLRTTNGTLSWTILLLWCPVEEDWTPRKRKGGGVQNGGREESGKREMRSNER